MKLINDLLSTDYGFFSLIVIAVIIVAMIILYAVLYKKMGDTPK